MPKPDRFLTAQEFAQTAGVSAGTVTKWLRDGSIQGKKTKGKWSISSSELTKVTQSGNMPETPSKSSAAKSGTQSKVTSIAAKSYSIQEFCDMTYLTEYGVRQWLKEGRLEKVMDSDGQMRVNASNLANPYIKRLLR